jgi:hypothetical protein
MHTVAVIFCSLSDLAAVLAAGLGQTSPSPTPPQPEPVKLPEPSPAATVPTQPEPPKADEQPPAPVNAATGSTEEPPRRRQRGGQEKPAATDPKTPAEAIVPAPTPLGPPPRQDSFAIGEEKPTDRPFRQRGPSVRPSSDGPPSINFDEIPENP